MQEHLEGLCGEKRLASLALAGQESVVQCRFAACEGDSLTLELTQDLPKPEKLPCSCTIVYTEASRTKLIFASAQAIHRVSGFFPRVTLSVPSRIVRTESRTSLRIPLSPKSELKVTVLAQGNRWTPKPVDISIGGILLDFSGTDIPDLWQFEDLRVQLEVEDLRVDLESFPGRRDGNCYAIYFSEALRQLRSKPSQVPSVLREILAKLESDWIQIRWGQLH